MLSAMNMPKASFPCLRGTVIVSHHSFLATQPLTSNERWVRFAPGELKCFVQGKEVGAAPVCQQEWDLQVCC